MLNRIGWLGRGKPKAVRKATEVTRIAPPNPAANGGYIDRLPTDEEALAVFASEWAARPQLDETGAWNVYDGRVEWFVQQLGSVQGASVLELGPLEAIHTYLLERHGAGPILAVEANERAFLRCLIVKNLLNLKARFLLGNFERLLAKREQKFDILFASGVLYHLSDPLPVLLDMVHAADRIFIWSHFFDADLIASACDQLKAALAFPARERVIGSERMTYHPMAYGGSADLSHFRGGVLPNASWVEEREVIDLFSRHGFEVSSGLKDITPNGPCGCLLATRAK